MTIRDLAKHLERCGALQGDTVVFGDSDDTVPPTSHTRTIRRVTRDASTRTVTLQER